MKCILCNLVCKNYKGLYRHIRYKHKPITSEQYYLLSNSSRVCLYCGKPTLFISIERGYRKFCSTTCSNKFNANSLEIKQKIKLIKYNDKNYISKEALEQKLFKNKCVICGKKYKSHLGTHLRFSHKGISTKNYYELYPEEYIKKQKNFKIKCKICNKGIKSVDGLTFHVQRIHHKTKEEYYDQYLKQNLHEGFCLKCGNKTNIKSIIGPYKKYCSSSCYLSHSTGKNSGTKPEKILKEILDTIQDSIGDYFYLKGIKIPNSRMRYPDFIIKDYNTIIEVDGVYWHKEKNLERDKQLLQLGFTILHIPDTLILKNLQKTYFAIACFFFGDFEFYKNNSTYIKQEYTEKLSDLGMESFALTYKVE